MKSSTCLIRSKSMTIQKYIRADLLYLFIPLMRGRCQEFSGILSGRLHLQGIDVPIL